MEPGTHFEERRHATTGHDPPRIGEEDLRNALEQRRLSGAVVADQRERTSMRDLQVDIAERPELLEGGPPPTHHRGLQRLVALVVDAESLRDTLDRNRRARHNASASRFEWRTKTAFPSREATTAHATQATMAPIDGMRLSY